MFYKGGAFIIAFTLSCALSYMSMFVGIPLYIIT